MRNHDGGGKMQPLHNVMLFEVDCVLENAVQVKQKQSNANGCPVLNVVQSCLSQKDSVDAEEGQIVLTRQRRLPAQ